MNATISLKLESIDGRLGDFCNCSSTLGDILASVPGTPPLDDIQEIRDRLNAAANRLYSEADFIRKLLEDPKLAMASIPAVAASVEPPALPDDQPPDPPAKKKRRTRAK